MKTIARGQVSFFIAEKGDDSYFISLNPSPLVMSDEAAASAAPSTPWYQNYQVELEVRKGEAFVSHSMQGAGSQSWVQTPGQPEFPTGKPLHVRVGRAYNADGSINSNITFAYKQVTITEEGGVQLEEPLRLHYIYITSFNDSTIVDGYVDIEVFVVDAITEPTPGAVETELYKEKIRLNFSVNRISRVTSLEQAVVTGSVEMKTTSQWDAATGYIPVAGKVIVYSDHGTKTVDNTTVNVPGIKIGDGLAYVQDLPFVDDVLSAALAAHIANGTLHTSQVEKLAWNNKLNIDDSSEVVNESLVFNRN